MKTKVTRCFLLGLLLVSAGCSIGEIFDGGDSPQTQGGGGNTIPGDPGKSYVGFAGAQLTGDRVDAPAGSDRVRIKPYSVLLDDYPRVLGMTPTSLKAAAGTFADVDPPWFSEPKASAQTAYSSLTIAFEGCLAYTATGATYSAAPTEATASPACDAFAHKFWSRAPSADELNGCVQAAVSDTSGETDPRRRWAYACATMLIAAGFLTY